MKQSIINESNEKYSIWKRLTIFVIDALMSFGVFLGIFFTLGVFSIKSIAFAPIQEMNHIMKVEIVNQHLPYMTEDRFGLIELDYDATMDKLIAQGLDVEKANEKYYEYKANIEKAINEVPEYYSSYVKFYTTYSLTSILSLTFPLFIFQLLIPIFTKNHQTLAMMMFKSALADNKTSTHISNIKVLLRFILILTVEYIAVYILLNWIGLFFVCLVSFATISIMQTRPTIHDLILKVKMKKVEDIYSE